MIEKLKRDMIVQLVFPFFLGKCNEIQGKNRYKFKFAAFLL